MNLNPTSYYNPIIVPDQNPASVLVAWETSFFFSFFFETNEMGKFITCRINTRSQHIYRHPKWKKKHGMVRMGILLVLIFLWRGGMPSKLNILTTTTILFQNITEKFFKNRKLIINMLFFSHILLYIDFFMLD
jgi:hypothetical protein